MACPPSFEPYVLTELDHTLPPLHVSGFLTFRLKEPIDAIPVLEAAVARLVHLLPFLGGNVASSTRIPGKKNVLEVQPPSESFWSQHPMLVIKRHDLSIDPGFSSSVVSPDDISNETFLPIGYEFTGVDPVWRFQANVMLDGVIVSFSLNHQALDGAGAMCVIDAFAKCCQNPNSDAASLPTSPETQSKFRKAISGLANASQLTGAPDHSSPTEVASHSVDIDELNQNAHNAVSRKLLLNAEKIKLLRKSCAEQAQPSDQGAPVSGNTIVTAILWICLIRAQFGPDAAGPSPPDLSSVAMVSNFRSKIRPNLPMTYLGNTVGLAWSSFSVEQVLSSISHLNYDSRAAAYMDPQYMKIVAAAANRLQDAVRSISERSVRDLVSEKNAADDWAAQPTIADLHVSSLRHFNLYALDFGSLLGRTSDFDMPESRFAGLAWILPSRGNPQFAPWEVRLTLQPAAMERIQKDPLLRWLSSDVMSKL
ncbi:Transferase [Penicillium brevicompactum]|uniref:Transferase n=1 Tax=Penicillium brevicompactum TaxID=5074 RepID=A0A9W9RLF6_PENBR|nr:Transferase [Penicillium brevicompactum]